MTHALSHTRCFPDDTNGPTVFFWDNGMICREQGHPDHSRA